MTQSSAARTREPVRHRSEPAAGVRGAISAIAPYIEDGAIEWEDLQRALESIQAVEETRRQLTTALREAGIAIRGRPTDAEHDTTEYAGPKSAVEVEPGEPARAETEHGALYAARRLMEQDIGRTRLDNRILTAEEEVGLGLIIRDGSEEGLPQGGMATLTGERRQAAETLYLHNTRLAWSVAQRYVGQGLDLDDLAQSAMVGLVRAVELFDPHSGHKFSTYATWWLRQAVTRTIADQGRLIRVPVYMYERIQKVWATREELFIDGAPPRLDDLARACGLTPKEVQECLILRENTISLDRTFSDDATSLGDILDMPDAQPTPFSVVSEKELRIHIDAVLDTLPEREAGIIALRNGLESPEPLTLDAIGEIYGVTRERIRQLEAIALKKLRHPSRSTILRTYL